MSKPPRDKKTGRYKVKVSTISWIAYHIAVVVLVILGGLSVVQSRIERNQARADLHRVQGELATRAAVRCPEPPKEPPLPVVMRGSN